jgi:hypothetical protein
MTKPPFSIALRISAEVGEGGDPPDLKEAGWRERLRPLASREPSSKVFPPDGVPSTAEATNELSNTFVGHPMVNFGAAVTDGQVDRGSIGERREVYVLAEIVLRPEFGAIPPGGEFPDTTDTILTEAFLVHAAPWSHGRSSDEESEAATDLLQRVVADLPADRWRNDG